MSINSRKEYCKCSVELLKVIAADPECRREEVVGALIIGSVRSEPETHENPKKCFQIAHNSYATIVLLLDQMQQSVLGTLSDIEPVTVTVVSS